MINFNPYKLFLYLKIQVKKNCMNCQIDTRAYFRAASVSFCLNYCARVCACVERERARASERTRKRKTRRLESKTTVRIESNSSVKRKEESKAGFFHPFERSV